MDSFLAIDLGAESGRLVQGRLDKDRIRIREIHRFPNTPIVQRERLCWDLHTLFRNIRNGLHKASADGIRAAGIGVDTWGVDFVLLDANAQLTGPAVAYRDARTQGMLDAFLEKMPAAELYARTGIQFMEINTLFQVFAMTRARDPHLAAARDLLLIPDYFHFMLCGEKSTEFTNATTTQMFNIRKNTWDPDILAAAGVAAGLFHKPVSPGTVIGHLTRDLSEDTGLGRIPVIAPATHDTGSAVAAVPASGHDWAFISSGTWSLMGMEVPDPVTSEQARAANFTNEGGVDGTIRFLKNIMGLWLVQRCRADFGESYDYGTLTHLAQGAPAFARLVNADHGGFLNPPSMTRAIADYCMGTGQTPPETPGEFVRCCLESLALHYRLVLDQMRSVLQRPVGRIHIIGGGSRNALLCRMTADATGLPVLAGPVEATAAGNILMQARATGRVGSLSAARAIVADSFETIEYLPENTDPWDHAYALYLDIREHS